jgi:hypothetical protein
LAAIVHQIEQQGPATHAIVIGVGDYPHLKGGKGPLFSGHENMGQLDSAPRSARDFAEWLIGENGYHDPARPLASLRLLLSEKKGILGRGTKFKNSRTGKNIAVPEATLEEVGAAVLEWAGDLNKNEDDLGIFFFSGHGIMVGVEQILLLSDFGNPGLNTRGAAIRFNPFRNGMNKVAARQQCYFLDACRAYTDAFADAQGARGENFIDPDPSIRFSRFAAQPVFNATVEGASAYGRDGEPSLFAQALLQALKGGGTDNRHPPYDWRIEVGHLNEAIEFLVRRTAEREGLGLAQIPSGQELVPVGLGKIQGAPLVPVALSCAPENATGLGRFLVSDKAAWKKGEPDPLVPYGMQKFEVSFGDASYQASSFAIEVRPPYKIVEVPVAPGGGA